MKRGCRGLLFTISIVAIISILSLTLVSAVWWNPFTWFKPKVQYSPNWACYNYTTYAPYNWSSSTGTVYDLDNSIYCVYGCNNQPGCAPRLCTDSDGFNISTRGRVIPGYYSIESWGNFGLEDICSAGNIVQEKICNYSTQVESMVRVSCPTGTVCFKGACVSNTIDIRNGTLNYSYTVSAFEPNKRITGQIFDTEGRLIEYAYTYEPNIVLPISLEPGNYILKLYLYNQTTAARLGLLNTLDFTILPAQIYSYQYDTSGNMQPVGNDTGTASPMNLTYYLNITSNPSNASIYIDGLLYGYTPKLIGPLSSGNYSINVTSGSASNFTIVYVGGSSSVINLFLSLTSIPTTPSTIVVNGNCNNNVIITSNGFSGQACLSGNFSNSYFDQYYSYWNCSGINGGTTMSCKKARPGVCYNITNSAPNQCTGGDLFDVPDSSSSYLWQCNGRDGAGNVSCSLSIPRLPGSCNLNTIIYLNGSLPLSGPCFYNVAFVNHRVTQYTVYWECPGQYGGSNASCQKNRLGQCGLDNNNCTAGYLEDIPDNSSDYLWKCTSNLPSSLANASCSSIKPVAIIVNGTLNITFLNNAFGTASNVSLIIDGLNYGILEKAGVIKSISLTPGIHTINLSKQDYIATAMSTNIVSKNTTKVYFTIKYYQGVLNFVSSIPGFTYYLNGANVGSITSKYLNPGVYNVVAVKRGYNNASVSVQVYAGNYATASFYPVISPRTCTCTSCDDCYAKLRTNSSCSNIRFSGAFMECVL